MVLLIVIFNNYSLINKANEQNYIHYMLGVLFALFLFNPFNIGNAVFLLILLYTVNSVMKNQSLYIWNLSFLVLVLFTTSYSLISYIYGYIEYNTALKYIMYFLTFFLFGKNIKICNEKNILVYFYMMIVVLSLFGILSVLYSMSLYGSANGLVSRTASIPWINTSNELLATNIGTYLSLGVSLAGSLFIGSQKQIKLFILNVIISTLSLYCTLMLGNRTGLIIAAISITTIVLCQIIFDKRNRLVLLFGVFINFLFLLYLYDTNFAGIQTTLVNSNSYARFEHNSFLDDPRFETWIDVFFGLFINPLGGKETYFFIGGYAHNLWLDVGWTTGIFPAILLLVFTYFSIKNYFAILKVECSMYFKVITSCCLVGFLLTFFVEPIIEGNLYLFTAFCFFSGAMQNIVNRKNKFTGGNA